MPVIHYKNQTIKAPAEYSVLETLNHAGFDIPHSCLAGACQSCKLQASSGALPVTSQQGLTNAEKQLGYFLSCQCFPDSDLTIVESSTSDRYTTRVLEKSLLSSKVVKLVLQAPFAFMGGQFVNVLYGDLTRSYSIASTTNSNRIELHIKILPDGRFSQFAAERINAGDELTLQGPFGKCIYSAPKDQTLLMVGLSTGIAPLLGVLRTALEQQHEAPIHFIAGAKDPSGLYMVEELHTLAAHYPHLTVDFVVQEQGKPPYITENIYQYTKAKHPQTKGYSIYLCGAETFVNKLKKQSFLLGANMADIHADSFTAGNH